MYVGGNIGRPLIELVDTIPGSTRRRLGVSSFQLELLSRRPEWRSSPTSRPTIWTSIDHGGVVSVPRKVMIPISGERPLEAVILNRDDLTLRQIAGWRKGPRPGVLVFAPRGAARRGDRASTVVWPGDPLAPGEDRP